MILKINYGDNDFTKVVLEACEKFMCEVCSGYSGKEAVGRYKALRAEYSLEVIKSALVKATYGLYIANHVVRLYLRGDPTTEKEKERYFKYFTKNFELTEVESFKEKWDNSEVAYIDFANGKVTIQ
jgi:hypothetical protein